MNLKANSKRNNSMPIKSSLTIMFEAPFWIGVYERYDDGQYEVCKITFGAEPKDYEVYEFLLKNWSKLNQPTYKIRISRGTKNKSKA